MTFFRRAQRLLAAVAGVTGITWVGYEVVPVNGATVGFGYLLFVLVVASTWGFVEATAASLLAALTFNFFFLEPRLTFTIADPQNWVALFAFLTTSIIASRLSTKARRRTHDALERQQDLERLYTFGRAILLIDVHDSFPKQLAHRLADTFERIAVALYDPRTDEIFRAGPSDFEGMDSQLREAAIQGTTFSDPERNRVITAVCLGAKPIASLALQGPRMQDSVLQSIANLVAIGLERAKAQSLAQEAEVSKRSDQLRTTLLDAMAHEFKTPLTSIRATTSALLSAEVLNISTSKRMLKIADEEAAHLEELIDDALDIARVDSEHIDVYAELSNLSEIVHEVVESMTNEIGDKPIVEDFSEHLPLVAIDRRLTRLAIKQILDNALKYSSGQTPVHLRTATIDGCVALEVTDHGKGIPEPEQSRIFERFYRGAAVQDRIPGSGLGLSIAHRILMAQNGDISVKSRPGETTFRLTLPVAERGEDT